MTTRDGPERDETEALLDRAGSGDDRARQQLLSRHRSRLRQMVNLRLDRRLVARIDPSDIVQEALADAARNFADYLCDRPVPFYPWLRRFAWERLDDVNRVPFRDPALRPPPAGRPVVRPSLGAGARSRCRATGSSRSRRGSSQ
jgi:hypothetical protein